MAGAFDLGQDRDPEFLARVPLMLVGGVFCSSPKNLGLAAKMRNISEACTAANRFFVQEDIAKEFATRLADRMQALHIGNGHDPDVAVGLIITDPAVAKVTRLVNDVIARANATEYGLACYFCSTDITRCLRVSERLNYGMVGVNAGVISNPTAPSEG